MIAIEPKAPPADLSSPLAQGAVSLTKKEFKVISDLARQQIGVELGEGKEQLVAARIGKLMRQHRFATFRQYREYLFSDSTGKAQVELIDALTTNHTSFFREAEHFEYLVQHILPEWNGKRPIRIWSAASSTGEEPYSIALTLREHLGSRGEQLVRILATDISVRVLESAHKGVYRSDRFPQGIAPWLRKHLLQGEGQWDGYYRMRPEIRNMVEFGRVNLTEPLPNLGRFDLIFCRNVMIYFSRATQQQVISRLEALLEPGGHLFVGHAESLTGIEHRLQQLRPAIYRKRGCSQ